MRALLLLSFFFLSISLRAQQRCGTVEYEQMRNIKSQRETKDQFEQWMQGKLAVKQKPYRNERTQSSTFVVPIVVHVVHNGEAVGTGTNISDAQILSQIDVLNKDYQRLNADASQTLSEFTGVAGSMDIQFVMAKQDPDGLATNGIVRVKGTQSTWTLSDDYTLKSLSYWPAEDYLNIWIVDLSGGFLGYTQLPVSNTLQGLEQSSNDRLTDGVVIDYQTYGTADAGSFNLVARFNKGRTATHEIGHYFGLRHIWGDANGCATDYVNDTPPQNSSTSGCPSGIITSCSAHSMYQNYLDYTDDACMNIFSQGQVSRMNVVIQNSPRRASLGNSLGATTPSPVANDLGVKSVLNPAATACSGTNTPSVRIRNYGSNSITSAQLEFWLSGNLIETKTLSLSLATTSETTISFSPVTLNEGVSYSLDFKVTQVNGGADGNSLNDDLSSTTYIPVSASLPLLETFDSTPANWTIENPSGIDPWQNVSVGSGDNAMYMNFYGDENLGNYSRLVSPVLDLTSATQATLTFDHAYSPYQGVTTERLRVLVYTSCAYSSSAVEIFNKAGTDLATTTESASSFTPSNSSQWQTDFIALNDFIGQKIQIAFEGTNGYGNNLYIDNVTVLNYPVTAFQISDLISPSPVSCQSTVAPVIAVKNLGNTVIQSFEVHPYVNGVASAVQTISGVSIAPNSTQNITINTIQLSSGTNTLAVAIKKPNGGPNVSHNDSLSFVRKIDNGSDRIPLRQNFNDASIGSWSLISPQSGQNWYLAQTNYDKSLIYNAYSNTKIGNQAWLVSPVLDFSSTQKASLFFDISYGKRSSGSDKLEVYGSDDCGETFASVLFSEAGSSLSTAQSESSWTPSTETAWSRQYINLDSYAGKKNIRLAFIATNGNGNNLYLDNIEFFESDNQFPVTATAPYNVYGGLSSPVKITFNLDNRQDARVQMYSAQGMLVSDQYLTDVLNQTFTVDVPYAAIGMYIVRVQIGNSVSATKVWIGF
jgi:hypothetical protein